MQAKQCNTMSIDINILFMYELITVLNDLVMILSQTQKIKYFKSKFQFEQLSLVKTFTVALLKI